MEEKRLNKLIQNIIELAISGIITKEESFELQHKVLDKYEMENDKQ